jgi:5-oxoprolinase (ATP-hydrolysing)
VTHSSQANAGGAGGGGGAWRIWVDTGGTFTDCIGISPEGAVRRAKVLSSSCLRGRVRGASTVGILVEEGWAREIAKSANGDALAGMEVRLLGSGEVGRATVVGFDAAAGMLRVSGELAGLRTGAVFELRADEEAPVLGARLVTGTPVGGELPPIEMRLGTTRGTNALLERRGDPVAFFVTRGHGDLLEIGTQQRPALFALDIRRDVPLPAKVIEVTGRLAADGVEIGPLDLAGLEADGREVMAAGVRSAAVAFLHSWINPDHERAAGALLRRMGFEHVSLSSELAPLIKILPRAQTAVVNAQLAGVMERYLARVEGGLGRDAASGGEPRSLHVMTSSGGLVRAREFRPKDSLLSGPAGGVVGAAGAGRAAGFERLIAFDMGGTSTDVSRFDGEYQYIFEHEVGGAKIVAPALAIETVAAGGGSVCWVDRGILRVGPQSAGASPGPACYGAGGPLTITDCNLLLGRLEPERFGIPVEEAPARRRLEELRTTLREEWGRDMDSDALVEGFVALACERMAEAISRISVRQGYDAAAYVLVAFGGAGGQHACAVAKRLGMTRVVLPVDAGLLSAAGLGRAAVERFAQRQVLAAVGDCDLEGIFGDLAQEAMAKVRAEGVLWAEVRRRLVEMRLAGQESTITIEHPAGGTTDSLAEAFRARYMQMYGHEPPRRELEIESARVVASSLGDEARTSEPALVGNGASSPPGSRTARFGGRWMDVPVHDRAGLGLGSRIEGPALIVEAHSTCVVEGGWRAALHSSGAIVLEREAEANSKSSGSLAAIRSEVSAGRLAAIAREMGEMLQRTAISTNVKERLDFSCAVLDAEGQLIVNAPHVPVHLGALGVCVRSIVRALEIEPGDVVVTNHPAFGGSHLPDVTAITPVHNAAGRVLAYVASRAHHAEIGGISPGSMPTRARALSDEGVVIPPMHLVRRDGARWQEMEQVLRAGPWPSRNVDENLADLRAQVAANRYGAASLLEFALASGEEALRDGMSTLMRRAAAGAAEAIAALARRGSRFSAVEHLDDGSALAVTIMVEGGGAVIDFAGSAPVHPGNLNATPAIVRSAVIYVLRLLVSEDLPLNEGLLEQVEIRIPEGMLSPRFDDDAAKCPPVAGGNVETSQRIVDVLLKALRVCACSQGTMNNTVFGTERYGYYETVCGGAGAGPGFAGASAVHTHMTNTRITDPEIMEHRYPVRLHRFSIRRGSGGDGEFRGGDGIVREIEFLEPCELSVISQHRSEGPYGLEGGEPGERGSQWLLHQNGTISKLEGVDSRHVRAGDRLVMETPGGGGWGAKTPGA